MPLQGQAVGIGAKFRDLGEVQYIYNLSFLRGALVRYPCKMP